MITEWKYRINVIIPAEDVDINNALWTIIAPNGDVEAKSFGIPLSASGEDPATHSAISTAATEEMKIKIEYIFAEQLAEAIISVQDYQDNDFEDLLVANGLQRVDGEVL